MKNILLALTLLLVGCTSSGPPALLTTYGTAVLRVPPEIFQLNLEVSSLDSDSARALTENERKLGQLRRLLEEFHVQAQDFIIEDSSVGLEEAAEKKVRRYQAKRSISVILYDLKQREDLSLRLVQQHLGDVSSRTNDVKDPPLAAQPRPPGSPQAGPSQSPGHGSGTRSVPGESL